MKIRYKLPKSSTSRLISTPIDRRSEVGSFAAAPQDARFAAAVAGFAEMLRGGKYSGSLTYDDVLQDRRRGARARTSSAIGRSSSRWCARRRAARTMAKLDP